MKAGRGKPSEKAANTIGLTYSGPANGWVSKNYQAFTPEDEKVPRNGHGSS